MIGQKILRTAIAGGPSAGVDGATMGELNGAGHEVPKELRSGVLDTCPATATGGAVTVSTNDWFASGAVPFEALNVSG